MISPKYYEKLIYLYSRDFISLNGVIDIAYEWGRKEGLDGLAKRLEPRLKWGNNKITREVYRMAIRQVLECIELVKEGSEQNEQE